MRIQLLSRRALALGLHRRRPARDQRRQRREDEHHEREPPLHAEHHGERDQQVDERRQDAEGRLARRLDEAVHPALEARHDRADALVAVEAERQPVQPADHGLEQRLVDGQPRAPEQRARLRGQHLAHEAEHHQAAEAESQPGGCCRPAARSSITSFSTSGSPAFSSATPAVSARIATTRAAVPRQEHGRAPQPARAGLPCLSIGGGKRTATTAAPLRSLRRRGP